MRSPSLLLVIIATALLFPSVQTSSPATIPVQPMAYASIFPTNITDSYRANWTSLSTSHIAGGDTGTVRFELTDLVDSGYTLVDTHGASKSTTATTGSYASDDVRIVSGSWDIMIDVQSFGSKTVSQVIAVFKVFGVYNTASGRLVLQSVQGDLLPLRLLHTLSPPTQIPNSNLSNTSSPPSFSTNSSFADPSPPPSPPLPSLYTSLPISQSCTFSADLQFFLQSPSSSSRPAHRWVIAGSVISPNCDISLEMTGHALNYAHFIDRSSKLSFLLLFTSLINLAFTVRQLAALLSASSVAARVSLLSIGHLAILDSYECLFLLFITLSIRSTSTLFGVAAFVKFITFAIFEMRMLLSAWRLRAPAEFEASIESLRRSLFCLYIKLYGAIACGLFVVYLYDSFPHAAALAIYSFWLPQIFHAAQHNHRRALQPSFIISNSLCRLALPLYVFACPENILSPGGNASMALLVTVSVLVQTAVLLLQVYKGGAVLLPKFLRPRRYNYMRLSIDGDVAVEMLERAEDCVICMQPFDVAGGESTAVTPCDHVFHASCLQQWMDVKLECPTCRQQLPDSLSQED